MEQPNTGNEPEDTSAKIRDASNPTSITEKEKAQLPPAENQNADTDNKPPKQSVWSRWQSHPLSDRVMSYFTGVVAVCAVLQILILVGGSSQTDLLIKAAQMSAHSADHNAASAQSFAESAFSINKGVNDAVARLQAQANVAESARQTSQSSSLEALRATVDNFHQEQRAWVYTLTAVGTPKSDSKFTTVIPIGNSGKTAALHPVMYFTGTYVRPNEKVEFTFRKGGEQHLSFIPPGFVGNGFRYSGGPDADVVPANILHARYFVYGAITYDDVFGVPHWLTYCFYAVDGDQYAYCKEHNDIGDGALPKDALVFH